MRDAEIPTQRALRARPGAVRCERPANTFDAQQYDHCSGQIACDGGSTFSTRTNVVGRSSSARSSTAPALPSWCHRTVARDKATRRSPTQGRSNRVSTRASAVAARNERLGRMLATAHSRRFASAEPTLRDVRRHALARKATWMSRPFPFVLLFVLVTACGGTTVVRSGDAGAGGSGHTPAKHRPRQVVCGTPPPGGGGASSAGQQPAPEMCSVDSDCQTGPNGRCIFGRIGQYCTYDECFRDGDCASGEVCMCGASTGTGSHCSQAGCRTDSDCPGSYCSPTFGTCGNYSGVIAYQCHTSKDTCIDDADCASTGVGAYCMYDPMVAHWVCSSSQCAG